MYKTDCTTVLLYVGISCVVSTQDRLVRSPKYKQIGEGRGEIETTDNAIVKQYNWL